MGRRTSLIILSVLLLALLVILAACSKKCPESCEETPKNLCTKDSCSEATGYQCLHAPIAGCTSGDGVCDEARENKCTAPDDCGACDGTVKGSTKLVYTCDQRDECVIDVEPSKVQPVTSTNIISSGGSRFKLQTTYNQPFNVNKDTVKLGVSLDTLNKDIPKIKLTKAALTGTLNGQQVSLGEKTLAQEIYDLSSNVQSEIKFNLVTNALEGDIVSPKLQVNYEYTYISGGKPLAKTGSFQNTYRQKISWVKPDVVYACPASCDDSNQGTRDYCNEGFCEHDPIAGACGNFACDPAENRCTCAQDCGSCAGSASDSLDYLCAASGKTCTTKLALTQTEETKFEDKDFGVFHLKNRYLYGTPFDVMNDAFTIEFTLNERRQDITGIRISSIRLLDGSDELGFVTINQALNSIGNTVTASVVVHEGSITNIEESHNVLVSVDYEYKQGGNLVKNTFTKSLGRIVFVKPGVPV